MKSEYHELALMKTVPGATYDRGRDEWRVPMTWAACMVLRGVFPDLLIDQTLFDWAWSERTNRIDPSYYFRSAIDADPSVDPMTTNIPLYGFQRAALVFLITAERALLASEMGTGKTPTTIRALMAANGMGEALPALIVCPNSMKRTWAREIDRWAGGGYSVGIIAGTPKQKTEAAQADIVICNWEALRGLSRVEGYGSIALSEKEKEPKLLNQRVWRTVIADEAHRAKDPRAQQTRALWAVAHDARYRWALTGTPVANAPDDLWAVMHFVQASEWPSKTRFIDRYGLQSWNPFGAREVIGLRPDTRDEFFRILDPRMRRDLKANVLAYLPPKIRSTRVVEMTKPQETAYKQMQKEMLAELGDEMIVATNPLAKALRLWQLASGLLTGDGENWIFDDGTPTKPTSCKLTALLDILSEAEGQPVVVFAESRRLIELCERRLRREGIAFGSVHGEIPEFQRDQHIQAFQEGRLPALLATLKAGGEGLTLTAAHVCVFLQRSWSLVENRQAEERVHRPGLDHPVEIIDLVTANTIEEYRLLKLADKDARFEEIVRDRAALGFGMYEKRGRK